MLLVVYNIILYYILNNLYNLYNIILYYIWYYIVSYNILYTIPMVSCRVAPLPDDAELARQMSERVVANAQSRSQVWKVGSVQHRHI